MGRAPTRDKDVYFVGAGLSVAFGLPSTQQLLNELDDGLQDRLDEAYRHFYPVTTKASGFRPDVVDFFSLLQSHIAITRPADGPAFPNPPLEDPAKLYSDLKWSIARQLITRARDLDLSGTVPALDEMLQPGNVIITSNWDFLIEAYAEEHGLSFYYRRKPNHGAFATIIKLHGSVDWCLPEKRRTDKEDSGYSDLSHKVGSRMPSKLQDGILRVRGLERLGSSWQFIRARSTEPFLITMAPGKNAELGPARSLWNDAYWALSSAKRMHVVGYSLPADDVEIRALIVAGTQRGNQRLSTFRVQNPSPDVHARFRSLVRRDIVEDYLPVARQDPD